MYAEGSRLLGLEPHECLFIDDDPQLVHAAHDVIVTLDGLVSIIEVRRTGKTRHASAG